MIEKRVAQNVLEAALTSGGDFSEVFVEDTEGNNISMLDGKVENAMYQRAVGVGVRVFKGTRSVYAYSSGLDEKTLMETAKAAADALEGVPEMETCSFEVVRDCKKAPERAFSTVQNAERIAILRDGSVAAKVHSPLITKVNATYLDVDQRIMVANSEGIWAEDRRPRTRVAIMAVASRDMDVQTGRETPGLGMGFEAYKIINVQRAGESAAQTAITMLDAPECPMGAVPVVIEGGFGGVILHEACVHSLEATSVAKGNSEFCGKLNTQIANPIVNVIDDGTLPGEWGTINVDDEGTPSQRNVLVKDGILLSYLFDRLGARRMAHPLTGSSRRESYQFAPTSRMTNTFFAPGSDDEEEMIRTMGDGLFAKQMGGGSVNPLTGEFNFAVTEGYWVKNGQIHCPVRGATLIGKGADVLLKIDRIASRVWFGQGMCGSLSGSVPTNCGQPRIRVGEITVGGKGGQL